MSDMVDSSSSPAQPSSQLREEHGRSFNITNTWYILPADTKEHERLTIQHQIFKHRFNGLVIPEATEAIQKALLSHASSAVLDVGTGSGAWCIDMAILYPTVRVVGIDMAPVRPTRTVPENCEFVVHDVNTGMMGYDGQFDVVHCRCIDGGIPDWKGFLTDVTRCLKPHGVLMIIGADGLRMLNEHREPITEMTPGKEGFSNFNRLTEALRVAGEKKRGAGITSHLYTQDWLNAMKGMFIECRRETYLVPLGAWDENLPENEKIAAEFQLQNSISLTSSFRPIITSSGIYSSEEVEEIIGGARDEVENMRLKQYIRWFGVWAIRA